jgi:DNA repair photolyase
MNAAIDRSSMNGKPVLWLEARTVINFKSGFGEKLLCDGLTFSTGTSCAYTCSFCYVPSMFSRTPQITEMLAKEDLGFDDVVIRRRDPIEIARKQLFDAKGRPKYKDDKRVIYASPLVDVAANMDLVRETIEMCRLILDNTGWTIRLLSKSNLLPQIAKALWGSRSRERVIYGVSTGTLDNDLAKVFEGGTPLVSKRIESLHWLQDNGFRTFGMICPSLPLPTYDYLRFSREMVQAIRVEKCEQVWAEVMNVRGESLRQTVMALHGAGWGELSQMLDAVQNDKILWEQYARDTFEAHKRYIPADKLRFLQYVDRANIDWWKDQVAAGAVLLGKEASRSLKKNVEAQAAVAG